MKINDKNLITYSVTRTHIDKEGYLLKKGEVNKNFQKRWFVLKGNLLFYFEKRGDKEPIGVIILEGCRIELSNCDDQFTFKIVFNAGNGRTYVLATDSQDALETWMKALARASYDYLKLMVAELQKRLDELNDSNGEDSSQNQGNSGGPKVPPRRHNPFNKPDDLKSFSEVGSGGARVRSNGISSAGSRYSDRSSSSSLCNVNPNKRKSFAQTHAEYGIPILKDKERYVKKNNLSSRFSSINVANSDLLIDLQDDNLSIEIISKKDNEPMTQNLLEL